MATMRRGSCFTLSRRFPFASRTSPIVIIKGRLHYSYIAFCSGFIRYTTMMLCCWLAAGGICFGGLFL
jgi:hypothetical protein